MQYWIYMSQTTQLCIFYLLFPYRQDIKELKDELSEERSKRTTLQVSGNAAEEYSSLAPGLCCCY